MTSFWFEENAEKINFASTLGISTTTTYTRNIAFLSCLLTTQRHHVASSASAKALCIETTFKYPMLPDKLNNLKKYRKVIEACASSIFEVEWDIHLRIIFFLELIDEMWRTILNSMWKSDTIINRCIVIFPWF